MNGARVTTTAAMAPRTRARIAPPIAAILAGLLLATGLTVVQAPPASAVAPTVAVSLSGGNILAGSTGSLTVSATNSGVADGFNLAVFLDVPVGVTFVSSSLGTPVIYDSVNIPPVPLPAGMQRWVWEDISDLPAGGSRSGTVTIRPEQPPAAGGETLDETVSPVGATVVISASAGLSGDPTYLPVFNGSTGVGGAPAVAETGLAGPSNRAIDIVSLLVDQAEPSPEAELLRGAHDHATTYTLTVTATTEGTTDNSVLVEYLPAGLEFLGCADADNSTVDRDLADLDVNEYLASGTLADPTDVTVDCVLPTTVTTIVADATLAADYGLTEGAVYTEIEWLLGTLAAGSVTTIRFAAAVPLQANTLTWDGAEPTPASGQQGSNLDNNNGASTRHGLGAPVDGQVFTSVAAATGDYQGVVRTGTDRGVGDTASESVFAMDLAIRKAVDGADSMFAVGNVADFTLGLYASEYMSSRDIWITDEVPNGLCPLLPAGSSFTLDAGAVVPAECEVDGTVSGAVVVSATAHADGTFTLVMRPTDGGDPGTFTIAHNGSHQVTYQALNRDSYVTATEYGSTTSGDSFRNVVSFSAITDAIAEILATYPVESAVWDDSAASISSNLTTIDKRIMERTAVEPGLGAGVDPCTLGVFVNGTATDFRLGDTVCFELRIDFPDGLDTRNPVATDYLPSGLTLSGYEVTAESTAPINATTEISGGSSESIRWDLGVVGAGGDLYVPRGKVFVAHLWAVVNAPSNGLILDKPENLLKYRQQNVEGELYFLRDQADMEVDPELQLVKSVEDVTDNSTAVSSTRTAASQADPDGIVFRSNRDGILVAEGETVGYRIDLYGLPYAATAGAVWDALPPGLDKSDLSAISDSGVAYDPGDPGYPAGIDPAYGARTVIVWSAVNVPGGQHTLRYDVTIPVGAGLNSSYTNEASLISYSAGINTSVDPAAQIYVPAGSLNVSLAASANTDGAGTRDTSEVHLPTPSITKSVTSPVATSNTASQVVKGELATSTYAVTIPAHTSVRNGVLSDAYVSASNWSIVASATQVTYPGGATTAGDASFVIGADTFTVNTATGAVTFPSLYSNTTDSAQVFTVHVEGYITSASTWAHSTSTLRNNTATFASSTTSNITATAGIYLIEPNPTLTKIVDDATVTASQSVTYTITASNASGRPTLFDTLVTDCVPAALISPTLGSPSQGSAGTGVDAGCTGTFITWNVGSLAAGASATLQYSATVSAAAAGGATYTNDVDLIGYSLASGAPDRETYTRTASRAVTVVPATTSKAVDAPTAVVGQERSYTITTTIPASVNFYDTAMIDDVPSGMTLSNVVVSCVDSAATDCTADLTGGGTALGASGTLQGWWLGDITSDPLVRTVTITYTGTVLDVGGNVNGTALVNTARLRWNTTDTLGAAPANASYTGTQTTSPGIATVTVREPSVGVSKAVNKAASAVVSPGAGFGYAVTATNSGTATGYDITVTDTAPVGVIVDESSISGGGVLAGEGANGGGTITWAVTSLAASGGSISFTYIASLAPSSTLTGAALTNTAEVTEYFSHPTGAGYDDGERRTYAGPTDTAAVTPAFPDPQVSKSATGAVAYIGEEHTFSFVITNTGQGTASGVTAEDVLPAGWEFVAGSTVITPGTDDAPAIAGQTLTWSALPDVAVGGTVTVQYRAVPRAAYTWTSLNTGADVPHTNTVDIAAVDSSGSAYHFDNDYFTAQDDASVTINEANLSITKSHTGDVIAGATTTWTVTVLNNGPDSAVGPIVVTDALPTGATFVDITGAGWIAGVPNGSNEVTVTRAATLTSGSSSSFTIRASFPANTAAGTDATNDVCVDARTFDPTAGNDCASDPDAVITEADLTVDKVANVGSYTAGEPISWDVTVTNNGPSDSQAPITVTDSLPAALDWGTATASGTGWTCDPINGADGEVTCTLTAGTLAAGASLPAITITADVLSSWTGTIVNTATVTGTTTEPTVPGLTNNSDTATTGAVDTEADLVLTKSLASADLVAGGGGSYRIDVRNYGPSDALNVIVTDQLPAGLAFDGNVSSPTGDTWACVASGSVAGEVDCTLTSGLGTVADGVTTSFVFDVTVSASTTGTVTNEATASSDTYDPTPANNFDDVDTPLVVETNISLAKSHDTGALYVVGDEVTFTLTVTNDGIADAASVTIADTLPAGLTYLRTENDGGWTVSGPVGSVLTIELDAPLPAGGSDSIEVVASLGSASVPGVTNVAAVTTTTTETDATDNDASDPVEVDTPDLTIVKVASETLVEGTDTFAYTLTVANVDDDATASPVTVTDPIPAALRVVTPLDDIGGTDWVCNLTGEDVDGYGGTLECELASLAPGATATVLEFDVYVHADVAQDVLTNEAEVSSPTEHSSRIDGLNDDDASVDVAWIDLTFDSVCVNEAPWFQYTIDARNTADGLPITFTWYPDANADRIADGPLVATQTLDFTTSGSPVTDEILWPGAAVDADGVGIAWPGWRVANVGETPDWENYVLDNTLPEYALRDGALVVVQIDPQTSVSTALPAITPACAVARDAVIDIVKTTDAVTAHRAQTITYTLSVMNTAYGATDDIVLSDPVPEGLIVQDIEPVASTDPTIPDWRDCTLTGTDADGSGGIVSCVLGGWLGYGQTAPDVLVRATFVDGAGLGTLTNVAEVEWSDPDDPFMVFSANDDAVLTVVYSAAELLAFSGFTSWSGLWWAAGLIGAGALMLIRRSRRA